MEQEPEDNESRTEGWEFHYFRDNVSLCRKWVAVGFPAWTSLQGRDGGNRCTHCKRVRSGELASAEPPPC